MRTLRISGNKKRLLLLLIAAAVLCSWLPNIDRLATEQLDQGFQRALVSFASARALNAAISVAQGTEAAIEPAGVGFTFTPGEILDPVNDLVEQFSDLMLVASVSFGIQKMLISIGAFWAISLALTLTAAIWANNYARGRINSPWATKFLVVLLLIRFAVPLVTLGSDFIFDEFMSSEYESSQSFVDTSSKEIDDYNQPAPGVSQERGIVERLRTWSQNISFESPVEELKAAADRTIEHIVNLMVIFTLQTLLLPILILWVLYFLTKRILAHPTRAQLP